MARQKGTLVLSSNFEVKAAAPLDARYTVATAADLLSADSWQADGLDYVYEGMQVYVIDTQKLYMLTAPDYTEMGNWTELSGIPASCLSYKGDVDTFDDLPDTGLTVGDVYFVTDEDVNYYWNAEKWVPLGSPDKSSFVWKLDATLNAIGTNTTVNITDLARIDDESIAATASDLKLGKTIVSDDSGMLGIVIAITETEAVIETVTLDDKSDGVYKTSSEITKEIDGETELEVADVEGLALVNIVINETMIYDEVGTVAVVTAVDKDAEKVTTKTITFISEVSSDGTYATTDIISPIIGSETELEVANIADLVLANVVINETLINDGIGTVAKVISVDTENEKVTVSTITSFSKSDGVYATTDVIEHEIGEETELEIANITDLEVANIVINETLVYDEAGTVAKVTAISDDETKVTVVTITKVSIEPSDGTYKTTETIAATIDAETELDATLIEDLVLAKVVVNETLIYDEVGTLAKVISIDTENEKVTVKTITKVDYSDGTYFTESELNIELAGTTTLALDDITDLEASNIVIGETQVYNADGTVGIITAVDTEADEITVTTITKVSAGLYKTVDELLIATVGDTTTLGLEAIDGLTFAAITVGATSVYDESGTVGIITAINEEDNEIEITTITSPGFGQGELVDDLIVTKAAGGIEVGTEYAKGTKFEKLWRDLLNPIENPVFTAPSAKLTATGPKVLETGSTLDTVMTVTFNRGAITPAYGTSGYRSGEATDYSLNGSDPQEGNTFNVTVSADNLIYVADVSYAEGEQPKNSIGEDYDAPLEAGSVESNTIRYEFVDALWANTADIATVAKLELISKTEKECEFVFPPQSIGKPEIFDVPASWTVDTIKVLNTLSGKYEDVSREFDTSSVTHEDAAGNEVDYTRYSDNRGYAASTRNIKITWK